MASKIGKALGFSMDSGESPMEKKKGMSEGDIPSIDAVPEEMDSDDAAPDSGSMTVKEPSAESSPEVMAMRLFDRATSPQAKVDALKAFGEACGWGGGDLGSY